MSILRVVRSRTLRRNVGHRALDPKTPNLGAGQRPLPRQAGLLLGRVFGVVVAAWESKSAFPA